MSDRLSEIRALIDRADHAYYLTGSSIMEDVVYDGLREELRSLVHNDVRFSRVGAPVPSSSILAKCRHVIPMGSQDKASSRDEFNSWVAGLGLGTGVILSANLKADGGSVSLEYVNGSLFRAVTRGDGFVGEDITANALKFQGLPIKNVRFGAVPFTGFVRAEIVLPVAAWKRLDPEMGKNPRNLGNGMSRRKDGADAEHLQVVAFRAYGANGEEIALTEKGIETFLRDAGFSVAPSILGDLESVWAFYEQIRATRSTLPYWIDGLVAKVDDVAIQNALGVSANRPRGQIALKFPAEGKETVLRSVELSVGHTGAIVPTAKFDLVAIGGVSVTSALLCNWDEIRALNVAIGDTVLVERRGDVIPKIVAVVHRPVTRQEIPEPSVCPVCGGPLERRVTLDGEDSALLYCANDDCPAKVAGKLNRWLSSLNILGIGDEVLSRLVEQLGVRDAADLYTLHLRKPELAALDVSGIRFGEKRATKVIEAIEGTRSLTLEQFIGSLGIDALGKRRVELIRQAVPGEMDTLSNWQDGTLSRIAERAGVPNVAARICADLERKRPLMDRLVVAGVSVRAAVSATAPQAGAPSVCVTGALSKPRGHYEELVKAKGWAWKADVSKGLTFLVMADPSSTSSKAEKARKHGTKCIAEAELLALLA